jgi:hypothetical protein
MTDLSTSSSVAGQMLWKREGEDQFLHLRHHPQDPWRPYEEFPQYVLPDPAGFSKGITTFVTLFRQGWEAVKS